MFYRKSRIKFSTKTINVFGDFWKSPETFLGFSLKTFNVFGDCWKTIFFSKTINDFGKKNFYKIFSKTINVFGKNNFLYKHLIFLRIFEIFKMS